MRYKVDFILIKRQKISFTRHISRKIYVVIARKVRSLFVRLRKYKIVMEIEK